MKTITVQATPGRSVPLSASCRRPDGGPRIITADQGAVEVEQLDAAAEMYIRRSLMRGDLARALTAADRAVARDQLALTAADRAVTRDQLAAALPADRPTQPAAARKE